MALPWLLLLQPSSAEPQPYDFGTVNSPHLFAEGIISTEDDEVPGGFSPDGSEFFFAKIIPYTTFPRFAVLCSSKFADGRWSEPRILPFSGQYLDFAPRMSPDGTRLLFSSSRPVPGKAARVLRIWTVMRMADGNWGEPAPLPSPVNLENHWNWGASVTREGTIYFASDRDDTGVHIFRSRLINGRYSEPEKLGPEINSPFSESDPFISPDERFIIFASSGEGVHSLKDRPETLKGGGAQYARADLYISENRGGHWTQARHLEHGINSVAEESSPFITPDGRYFFFSSERSPFSIPTAHRFNYADLNRTLHSTLNGHGNIYFVGITALGLSKRKGGLR